MLWANYKMNKKLIILSKKGLFLMHFFTCLMMCFAVMADAQSNVTYTTTVEAGLIKGSNDKSGVYFFTNGISYKNITAGIGVGIDGYVYCSVPLFLDVKKQFGHHKIKPFVGASAGINIQYLTTEQKNSYNPFYQNPGFNNGFFTKASVGVSMPVYHKLRMFVNAGYSYKTTSVTYSSYPLMILSSGMQQNTTTDIYHFNRWFVSIALWL